MDNLNVPSNIPKPRRDFNFLFRTYITTGNLVKASRMRIKLHSGHQTLALRRYYLFLLVFFLWSAEFVNSVPGSDF